MLHPAASDELSLHRHRPGRWFRKKFRITRKITISEGIAIKELSEKLEARAKDVIKRLLDKGIFATINQTLDGPTASKSRAALARKPIL